MYKFICFLIIFSVNALSGCPNTTHQLNSSNKNAFLLAGNVRFVNNQLSLSENWWEIDERETTEKTIPNPDSQIEADIINCSGYLASAKVTHKTEKNWQAAIIPDTVVKDVSERIRLCDESLDSPYITGTAFAVTPRKEKRKNIKLEKTELQKIFASLSWSNQSWANCTQISDENNCVRKEKNTLSRFTGDDWADIDGDGEIDLILLKGNCSKNGDYTCTKTLLRNGKGWTEIAYSKPA